MVLDDSYLDRFVGFNRNQRSFRRVRSFDPTFLVRDATLRPSGQQSGPYVAKNSFLGFSLHSQLLRNIEGRGYKTPTPIQDQAIPHLLSGRDVVGIAGTGTGKTAAFLIPLINRVMGDKSQRVLIMSPTRELAAQTEQELKHLTSGMNVFSTLCIGGVGMGFQIRGLQRNPNFAVGTPGRLIDLEKNRKINFSTFGSVVLDEVDRMLDMGFIHDMTRVISQLPKERNFAFFSATMPDNVQNVARRFLRNPVTIKIETNTSMANIAQNIVKTNGKAKIEVLHDLLIKDGFNKVLVFGRTKFGLERLARDLGSRGFDVAAIHGNKSQGQRLRALESFRSSRVKVLLATDVASRGLDVEGVTHVINFDLPETREDYIHRIGRTGRVNNRGVALTLVD